jgi:hypothetical protein
MSILQYGKYLIRTKCSADWCKNDPVMYSRESGSYYLGYCAKHKRMCRKHAITFNSLDDVKVHIAMREL